MKRNYINLLLVGFFLLLNLSTVKGQSNPDKQLVDSLVKVADSLNKKNSAINSDTDKIKNDTSVIKQIENFNDFKITGLIKDKNTGEGIPFATVFFPRTPIGTASDADGKFELDFSAIPIENDTFRVQAIGYLPFNRIIYNNNHRVEFLIELVRENKALEGVVVKGGLDPALAILKRIEKHKPKNDPDNFSNFKYEIYNKMEVDIQNLTKKQFERLPIPMIRKFSFIYQNLDSTTEKKPFLPFFLTETISDYYQAKNPNKQCEVIKASQTKGIKNESIDQFLGTMYQTVNVYKNTINVFDLQFISPIASNAPFYYKYKIKDTQILYGQPIILVQFTPKRSGEHCFFGDFWVAKNSWSIQRVSLEVPNDVNINWVKRVSLYQEFQPLNDSIWFCIKDKTNADFIPPYNMKGPGFIGRKSTLYKNIKIDDPTIPEYLKTQSKLVIVNDSAKKHNSDFWENNRFENLSKNEKAIYRMIDTLNSLPAFTNFKNLVKFLGSGVYEKGNFEFGPYWYLYSSNRIEGNRFRMGLNTTSQLFKKVRLSAYGAYGTLDQKWKYKGSLLWLISKYPRTYFYTSFMHDLDRSTNYYSDFSSDNIFNSYFKKVTMQKLAFTNDARFEFFKELKSGLSYQLTFQHKDFIPYAPLPANFINKHNDSTGQLINAEAGIKLRYAYHEKFLESDFLRTSLGTVYPVLELQIKMGIKNILNSSYEYYKAIISVKGKKNLPPIGRLYYNVFMGKTFGKLPYPLLEVHPGNDYYTYNSAAFNMMNRYEFLSDRFAGFFLEHDLGGGIFNYIPYLKKAKLRQFWTAKGVIGKLSDANINANFNHGYLFRTLEGNPYLELGTGVANILQIFRIDFVWRVTPAPLPNESKEKYFGIFGSAEFNF